MAIKSTESENRLGFIIISLRLNYRWIWTGVPVTSPISDSAAEQFLAVVHHRLYVAEPSTALPKFGGFRRGLLGLTITMNNNRFSGVFPVYWTEFVWAPGFRTVRHAPWKDRNPGLAFARRYTARWSGSTTLFRYGRCDTGRAPRLPLRSSPHRNRQIAVYFGHPGASALSIRARSGRGSFLPRPAPMRYTRAMQAACGLLSAFALRAPAQVHLALAHFSAAADGLPAGRRRGKRPTNEKQIGRMAFA